MKKYTRTQLISYLVDVLGNSNEEAEKIASLYGISYLTAEQVKEFYNFIK